MQPLNLPPGPLADQVAAIGEDQSLSKPAKEQKLTQLLTSYVEQHLRMGWITF